MNARNVKLMLKYGLFMGTGFCLYTTLMWLTRLDSTYLNIGQYLDMLIVLLPVAVIFLAIKEELQTKTLLWWQRMLLAMGIGVVSYVIYEPYLYLYHHYINPDWFSYVLQLKETELNAAHTSPEKINETLQQMHQANTRQDGLFKLSTFLPSVVILPSLIALVSLIFVKKKAA